jgi:hypothetical protein
MKPEDPTPANNTCSEPHIPQEIVLELLHCQLRNNIAPLGLEIDCAQLRAWSEEHTDERFRYQNLVRELRAWNKYLGRRPVNRIWINEPFALMDAPALTELVHAVAQNLKLIKGHHVEHSVTLALTDFSRQNIALLKGLEFNHIQIRVPEDFELQQLQNLKQILQEFKFPYISLQLDFDSESSDFMLRLMELLSFIEPSTLGFHPSRNQPFVRINNEGLTALLMQFGYYLQEPAAILKFHSPFHGRPIDCVRLGPGAASRFGALRTLNFATPDSYQSRVQTSGLPVATCR